MRWQNLFDNRNHVDLRFRSEKLNKEFKELCELLQSDTTVSMAKRKHKGKSKPNMQDTRRRLGNMQAAYDFVVSKTFPYFDVHDLKEKETTWYVRLSKTVAFTKSVS